MAKAAPDTTIDTLLNLIKNANTAVVCTSEPTTYAEATSSYALADVTIASTDFTGPANAGGGGRVLTFNGKSSISIDASGSADHVAFVSASSSSLVAVTTCTTAPLVAGNLCTLPGSLTFTVGDPT